MQHRHISLVSGLQFNELAQHRLIPRFGKGPDVELSHHGRASTHHFHAAHGIVQVAVGLHRTRIEVTQQIVNIDVQPVLLFVAGAGYIIGLTDFDVSLWVAHHGHGARHVPHQRADVDARATLGKVAFVQRQLDVIQSEVGNVIGLFLQAIYQFRLASGVDFMRLDVGIAHHIGPVAGQVQLFQRLHVGQRDFTANRIPAVVLAADPHDVLMHPHALVRPHHRIVVVLVDALTLAGLANAVPVLMDACRQHSLDHRLVVGLASDGVDALLQLLNGVDVHGHHFNQVRAGVDRIAPVAGRIETHVFNRHQHHLRPVLKRFLFLYNLHELSALLVHILLFVLARSRDKAPVLLGDNHAGRVSVGNGSHHGLIPVGLLLLHPEIDQRHV